MKDNFQDDLLSMNIPSFISSTRGANTVQESSPSANSFFLNSTCPITNIDMGNDYTTTGEKGFLPNNDATLQLPPSAVLPQNQTIPSYGFFDPFLACFNGQGLLPTSIYSGNLPLLPTNFDSFSSLMLNTIPVPTLPVTNTHLSQEKTSIQSQNKISHVSSPHDIDMKNSESIWSQEQKKLGNFLHSQIEAKYPDRCGKLVGMILTENKIKDIKFVKENSKAFFEKVKYFNQLLDDVQSR